MGEIDILIESLHPAGLGEQDPADLLPETKASAPVTNLGDSWLLDHHRVLCGNSLDESSFRMLLGGRRATMVFADPPYNVPIDGHATGLGVVRHRDFAMGAGEMTETEFTGFLTQSFGLLARHSADGSIHFICMDWRHMAELQAAGNQVYSELKNLCVWVKDNAGMGTFYRSRHELIFAFKAGRSTHRNYFSLH